MQKSHKNRHLEPERCQHAGPGLIAGADRAISSTMLPLGWRTRGDEGETGDVRGEAGRQQ